MEYFGYLGWILALVAIALSSGQSARIARLERKYKEGKKTAVDSVVLMNLLKENLGKVVKLDFFEEDFNFIGERSAKIVDFDERFVYAETHVKRKKKTETHFYLLPIENIKSVTVEKAVEDMSQPIGKEE